jgi:membrane associated rhomboid family serine protease
MLDYILARMIPVRDVVPTRTAPGVTLALLGALGAACAWPEVREWWLPWIAHGVVLWIAGGTVEDRLGHGRFAVFVAACLAVAIGAPAVAGQGPTPASAVCGAAAGIIAAHAVMFPQSRVLTIVPVIVGIEVADVPACVIFALWFLVQVGATWAGRSWPQLADPLDMALSAATGAAAGVLGSAVLGRPERMRVDWWDPPTRRP